VREDDLPRGREYGRVRTPYDFIILLQDWLIFVTSGCYVARCWVDPDASRSGKRGRAGWAPSGPVGKS
jgi:hypothetical protein